MESYVNSSILLQRAASQFEQLLREPSPPARSSASSSAGGNHGNNNGHAEKTGAGSGGGSGGNDDRYVVNAEVRLGDAKAALLLGQMRFHMQDYDAANVMHQRALGDVRECHAQWTKEAEAAQQRLRDLLHQEQQRHQQQRCVPTTGPGPMYACTHARSTRDAAACCR